MSQNAFAQIERETNEAEALREHTRMERIEMEELNKGYEFTKAQIAELESLRAENAMLKSSGIDKVVKIIAETEVWKECETLRARLAEIEKQEPVGTVIYREYTESTRFGYIDHRVVAIDYGDNKLLIGQPLYAAPVVSPDVEKLKAEIVSLRQQICASQSNVMARDEYIQSLTTELVAVLNDVEHKQCRIDELILEFCPSEMTADQLNRWRKCQIPAIEQAKGGA